MTRTGPAARIPFGTDRADLHVAQVSAVVLMTTPWDSRFEPADVHVTISDGAGGYYIGGAFSHVGGRPRANLAHVRRDGKIDPRFKANVSGPGNFGQVNSLIFAGDRLFVGGSFTAVNGHRKGALAALEARTGEYPSRYNLPCSAPCAGAPND